MNQLVVALEETWTAVRKLLGEVQESEWDLPTPCSEWTVRDLAAHLAAVESQFQGLPQPEAPPPGPDAGIDGWTAAGVTARRGHSVQQLLEEIEAASDAQLAKLRGLDEAGWQGETFGPIGPTTEEGLARIRIFDVYIHVLDLRAALGRPLAVDGEPTAVATATEYVMRTAGWGAVKKAQLPDGTRLRIELTGPGGGAWDVTVDGARGAVTEAGDGSPDDVVSGTSAAFFLSASGRPQLAEAAGGITATGEQARRFLDAYRLFG